LPTALQSNGLTAQLIEEDARIRVHRDMVRNKESEARIKLAGRILIRIRCGGGPPILPDEIARLRFLAECDRELAMPVEALAQVIIGRERARMGIPRPAYGIGPIDVN